MTPAMLASLAALAAMLVILTGGGGQRRPDRIASSMPERVTQFAARTDLSRPWRAALP